VILAYEMNGQPLPPQHGYPLRLVVPGWYGMTSVKWVKAIPALTEEFSGFQQKVFYRIARDDDDPGTQVSRMFPRSLLVPPGIPEFETRDRLLPPGPVVLEGRAWSGWAPIARVEVSLDGGASWADAGVETPGRAARVVPVELRVERRRGQTPRRFASDRRGGEHPAWRAALEHAGRRQQHGPDRRRARSNRRGPGLDPRTWRRL